MGWFEKATGLEAIPHAPFQAAEAEERMRMSSIADPEFAVLLGYTNPGMPSVSNYSALTLSAVYRAVSIVASSIAGLPMPTMSIGPEGQVTKTESFLDNPGAASSSDGVRMTCFEWKEFVTVSLLLQGNVYLQHIFNGAGQIIALNPVCPSAVSVEWDSRAYGGKLFTVQMETGGTQVLDGTKMTQIMGLSLDGLEGLSAISMARQSLGTAMAGEKAAGRQFQNGAMISGLVTPAEGQELSTDDAKTVKDHINRNMLGAEHAGDIPVINRRLQFQPWSLSAQDAQFIESRTFSIDEVGRWFGVPPHLLGLTEKSTSWGQGIAEQNRGLSRYTLSSTTNRIQERLSTLLPEGKWVEFDFTAFVKPSPEDEIKLIIEQVNSGLLTLNEARALRNLPPVKGGDLTRLPAGSLPPDQWVMSNDGKTTETEEV